MVNFLTNNIDFLLLSIEVFGFIGKLYIFLFVAIKAIHSRNVSKPLMCLLGIIIGGTFVDLAWIVKFIRQLFIPTMSYELMLFFIRLGWAFNLLTFHSLGLFIELLSEKRSNLKLHQKLFFFINTGFIISFIYFSLFHYNLIHEQRSLIEWKIINFCGTYWFQILIIPSLAFTLVEIKKNLLPKILKKQINILISYLILPFTIAQFFESFVFETKLHACIATCISTLLLTIATYFCVNKIMGLRFLNFQDKVQSTQKFNFIIEFKKVLEDLGHISNFNELNHIIQGFFKDAFEVSPSKTVLYIRKNELMSTTKNGQEAHMLSFKESIVENFLANHEWLLDEMKNSKIFIKDEIAFSDFYQESETHKVILQFLEQLQADVFLPVFEKNVFVGYIIIEVDARGNKFFSNVEHDELVVVAGYLSKVINLLYYSNINAVLAREKKLNEEVYHQHRHITQYQECLSTFMRNDKQRKIGVLFYKYRKFVFANQAAKEIITINVNMQEGHPLTQALRRISQQVENYKTTQTTFAHDLQGNRIVLLAIPNLERNNVIIIVYYPEISDVLKYQIDKIGNPSNWHYVLCLETTKSGELINQMIPGSGPQLLNFKVNILRMATSKKALVLDVPRDDVTPTLEVIHYISLRKSLHRLTVTPEANMQDVAVSLFGINPLYAGHTHLKENIPHNKPLFEQLSDSGTLFIENIHLLDLEIQNTIANYLKYGHYTMYKGTYKLFSTVRIICSTNQDLQALVFEGKFSKLLYEELKENRLTLPSLLSLPEEELNELIEGFTEQAVAASPLKNLLELSAHERFKIVSERPMSLQEFKAKVKNALIKKSQKQEIYNDIKFETSYTISDPELAQAARLGKKAMKDPKTLAMLLRKLKTQSKVADFLGVNRSSINRRLKAYNLI